MGNKYDATEMNEQLNKFKTQTSKLNTGFTNLAKDTTGILTTNDFSGAYQQGVKAFYSEVHIKAMDIMNDATIAYNKVCELLIKAGTQLDNNGSAVIDNDYLINDLDKKNTKYSTEMKRLENDVNKTIGSVSDIVALSKPKSEVATKVKEAKTSLTKTKNNVDKFSNFNETSEIDNLMSKFKSMLAYMDSCQSPSGIKYKAGDLAKQPWYKDLMKAQVDVKKKIKDLSANIKGMDVEKNIFSKDPVNLSTGNLIYDKIDISTSSLMPLVFKRFYNSIDTYQGSLGKNWIHNFDTKILSVDDNEVKIIFEDGCVELFELKKDNVYVSNKLNRLVYEKNRYYLHLKEEIRVFNERKQLIRIDNQIKPIELEYDFNNLILVKSNNEFLRFEYENNKIISITNERDFKVSYQYDKDNNLIESNDINNKKYQYSYDEYSNLISIINPKNINILNNYFDTNSRTTKQDFCDGSTMSYNYYDSSQMIELVERNGSIIKYYHDDKYRSTKVEFSDGFEEYSYTDNDKRSMKVDKNGNKYRYRYDEKGNLKCVIDPYKNKKEFTYNENDKVTSITLENGAKYQFEYDSRDNLIKIINALGYEMKLSYNHNNLPIETIEFDGSSQRVKYDDNGNIIKIIDALDNEINLEYNEFNQVIKVIKADLSTISYTYTNTNKIESITNELNEVKKYEYTFNDEVAKVIDYDGSITLYEYNSINKISKIIEANGAITKLEYDNMWNISKIIYPNNGEHTYTYNKLNQLKKETNPLAATLYYEYDKNGNRIKVSNDNDYYLKSSYDALNREIKQVDSSGDSVEIKYDEVGNVIKVTNSLNASKEFKYDLENNLIEVVDELGNKTKYTYTKLNKIKSVTNSYGSVIEYDYYLGGLTKSIKQEDGREVHYKYDSLNRVIEMKDKADNKTSYEYDLLGQIISIKDAYGNTQSFEYDKRGNITKKIDENNREYLYEYDVMNNLVKAVDASNSVVFYEYDIMNQLSSVKQAKDVNDNNKVLMYEYTRDLLSNITSIKRADNSTIYQEYNGYGQIIKQIDQDKSSKNFKYGVLGLLESIEFSNGKSISYEYDILKQVKSITNELGSINFSYDIKGNIIEVSDVANKVIKYQYGAMNELASLEYPNASKVAYNYDKHLKLVELDSDGQKVNYKYDDSARMVEKLSNNTKTSFSYDSLNRLSKLQHQVHNQVVEDYHYQYDNVGNIKAIEKLDGLTKYGYDKNDRLIEVVDNNDTRHYEYDYLGNRTKFSSNDKIINYYYNEMNQLIKEEDNDSIKEYVYDRKGRVISDGIKEYYYNENNKLSKVKTNESEVSYKYDGLNNLVARQVEDKQNHYVINPLAAYNNILEVSNQDTSKRYTYDGLGIHSINNNETLLDHLGSTTSIISNDNITKLDYDEFGNSLENNNSYTGYLYDEVSQLNYAQARFYDSRIGRFISEDNIVNADIVLKGYNRYNYVESNPLKYVDRDGNVKKGIDNISEWMNNSVFGAEDEMITDINNPTIDSGIAYVKSTASTTKKHGGQIVVANVSNGKPKGVTLQAHSINTPFGKFGLGGSKISISYDDGLTINTKISLDIFSIGPSIDNSITILGSGFVGYKIKNGLHQGNNEIGTGVDVSFNKLARMFVFGDFTSDDGTNSYTEAGLQVPGSLPFLFASYIFRFQIKGFLNGFKQKGAFQLNNAYGSILLMLGVTLNCID